MRKLMTFVFICLSYLMGNTATYYVSTTGNDSNAGTIGSPWLTWQKGFTTVVAGDTLLIRGGTYATSGFLYGTYWYGVRAGNRDGTLSNPINVLAYTGEVPVLDCATMVNQTNVHYGIMLDGCDYWNIKGLTVKNSREYFNGVSYLVAGSVSVIDCTNILLEKCTVTNCGNGFGIGGASDYISYVNCDSYKNYDRVDNGGYANGFSTNINPGKHATYTGCRAWSNSDDGFDQYGGDGYVTITNCWAFKNGNWVTIGNGAGFKLGAAGGVKESGIQRTVTNSLAFDNTFYGFDESADVAAIMDMHFYNNISFRNSSRGFAFLQTSGTGIVTLTNNISYNNSTADALRASVVQTTNSWQNGITVTNADFISVDTTGVSGARQANGDLPDLNFLKLASGSDLIDAGIYVGLSFVGSAPDLGAFEFSTNPPPTFYTKARRNSLKGNKVMINSLRDNRVMLTQ